MKKVGEPAGSFTLTPTYRILIAHHFLENLLVVGMPSLERAGGVRIVLHTELFLSLLSSQGAFSSVYIQFVSRNFSGGKHPDPQINIVLLGDQYTKHYSSGKEFGDQNL